MAPHLWLFTTTLLLVTAIQGGGCLRNVSLTVKPPAVQRGRNASFLCQYELEGAELYSVKFYRGRFEFYRYTPGDTPAFKVFRFPGINVDLSGSDEHQVLLRDVGFNLSGNLSCEVTVEAPKFTTITVYNRLLVVEFPKGPPELTTDQERYFPGDVLKANCTSPPSRPPASLSFLLNNSPVGTPDVHHIPVGESALLHTSFLSLSMQLFPSHYVEDQLILKCTAFLSSLYRNTSELSLGARPKEPIPEKVTSHNGSGRQSLDLCVLLVALTFSGYSAR